MGKSLFKNWVNIIVISLLFFGLVFSTSNLVDTPEFNKFCPERSIPSISPKQINDCNDTPTRPSCLEGYLVTEYDDNGCVSDYSCSTCNQDYENARKESEQYKFIINMVFGFFSILLVLRKEKLFGEIISTGLILGGLLILFYSSIGFYDILNKYLRVLMFAGELILFGFLVKKKFY